LVGHVSELWLNSAVTTEHK